MKELEIQNTSEFCVLDDGDDYVFYNPNRHYACRLTLLDLSIFNLIYKYKNLKRILTNISALYHPYVTNIYNLVEKYRILDTTPISLEQYLTFGIPTAYYLHLTYSCNLNCTYCYNKSIRKKNKEITLMQWKHIIDNIIVFANRIVLTGGEPFLRAELYEIISYVRKKKSNIKIEIISNCMVDFESYPKIGDIFNSIDAITFSCDNLSGINQPRKNFNAERFQSNISYVKSNFPSLKVLISSVYSKGSEHEQCLICDYCKQKKVDFRSVLVVPPTPKDVNLLPLLEEYEETLKRNSRNIPDIRTHCGAGVGVLSVSPEGDLFPCQSLMYPQYLIGNLLKDSIEELMHKEIVTAIRESFSVENIPVCKECNLRYLCAAGCRAATMNVTGSPSSFPEIMCDYYKVKHYNVLRSIPKMSEINVLS